MENSVLIPPIILQIYSSGSVACRFLILLYLAFGTSELSCQLEFRKKKTNHTALMGRSPCCEKIGLKKGPWTPEEDQKLLAYIQEHGHGSWRALPVKAGEYSTIFPMNIVREISTNSLAGLQRCGKSCRLRWTNYLRPDIKRGKFSLQEEQTIIQLHALLGNR